MSIYQKRLAKLQCLIKELNYDAFLIDDSINLYYLTGLHLSAGILLVHAHGAHLLVDGRYYEACKSNSPVPVVLTLPQDKALTDILKSISGINNLAFSNDTTSYKRFSELQQCIDKTVSKINLIPAINLVKQLRAIKDPEEIVCLREAASLGTQGFNFVCGLLKEGISEIEIACELEIFWKRRGSKCVAFDPIIAFGANSAMPHYRAGSAKLKKGDTVLIDIGVNYNHYHSDMTRVIFYQDANPKILSIYEIVKAAQAAALDLCRPGTRIGDLDSAARDLITSHGYGSNFTHSLGHGIGLEIHEWPILRNAPEVKEIPLQAGMVITIEPGIYLPGVGGVRLEDSVVITDDGYENLTCLPLL